MEKQMISYMVFILWTFGHPTVQVTQTLSSKHSIPGKTPQQILGFAPNGCSWLMIAILCHAKSKPIFQADLRGTVRLNKATAEQTNHCCLLILNHYAPNSTFKINYTAASGCPMNKTTENDQHTCAHHTHTHTNKQTNSWKTYIRIHTQHSHVRWHVGQTMSLVRKKTVNSSSCAPPSRMQQYQEDQASTKGPKRI